MASVLIFASWGEDMTEKEKYRQVRREAIATGVALLVLIGFWLFAGFGLSGVDATLFSLPLWSVMGSVGVWLFAILLSWILAERIFRDMELEEEHGHE